jgi:hypothetical protein
MSLTVEGTDYIRVPVGTTAQRPVIPSAGMIRQNSTTGLPEWYNPATGLWVSFSSTP